MFGLIKKENTMFQSLLGALFRQVLTAGGATVVSQGLLSGDQLHQVVGAGAVLASTLWSAWQKYSANAKIVDASKVKYN